MRISWSIGHHPESKGAYSNILGKYEFDIAKLAVERGIEILKLYNGIEAFIPKPDKLSNKIKEINNSNCDLAIESHFNSSFMKSANGCETIYLSNKGKIFAEFINKMTLRSLNGDSRKYEIRDRGAKSMLSFKRVYNGIETIPRYAFLTQTKMPAVICEPLFISNENDCEQLLNNFDFEITRLAEGVTDGIIEYFADRGPGV